jgi:alpha-beta hydrolase superfamily lysophospholipase
MLLKIAKHLLLFVVYAVLGCAMGIGAAVFLRIESWPDLKPWHLAHLDAEFRAADVATDKTFNDYQRREDRLFEQLRTRVYERTAPEDQRLINRYSAGSRADPMSLAPNWNRSFEWPIKEPRGGALLIHGLSDSPYSMRALAERMRDRGYWVIGLRLPGHGTAPSGLAHATWEDFAASTRLALRHLHEKTGDGRPLYVFGYSTGAALAVECALARLSGEDLPKIDGLVLLSPAIGVTPLAAAAVWQTRLARVPGLERLVWTDVGPEFDPYKYISFTANAGDQIYRLTRRIDEHMTALAKPDGVNGMPPILAFQSVADATVSTSAVIDALFRRLAIERHELVLFDINRRADAEPLLRHDALDVREKLLGGPPLNFELTVLTNAAGETLDLVALRRTPASRDVARENPRLTWPPHVYSLSHVALSIPPDDPVYGAVRPGRPAVIYLGHPQLQGERGLLTVPADQLIRLRYNPFYAYVEARIDAFLGRLESIKQAGR